MSEKWRGNGPEAIFYRRDMNPTNEQRNFSQRLQSALVDSGLPMSATKLSAIFNRFSPDKITIGGARKWLKGEAIPMQTKLAVLANLTGTHPAWLRFGIDPRHLTHTDRINTFKVAPFFADDLAQVPRMNIPILADFVALLLADQAVKECGRRR